MNGVGRKQLAADLTLVLVTLIWGGTFVVVQDAVRLYPVFGFLTVRFSLATLGMLAVFGRRLSRLGRHGWGAGILIGLFLFSGYAFQTLGLQYTSATKAGLITGLQTVSVPLMAALVLRHWPERRVVLAAILAVIGLGMLSLQGALLPERGDLLVLICALSFGAHITAVGILAPQNDAMALTTVQIAFVALASGVVSLFTGGIPSPIPAQVWGAAAFTGLLATCFAYGVQNAVSKYTTPTHTGVVFAMEPVFAALFGFLLAGERLGPRALFGGCLILLAVFMAEIRDEARVARLVSRALNPLYLSGPVLILAALKGAGTWWAGLGWAFFTVVIAVGIPFAFLKWELRRGGISDWHISRREERLRPSLMLMSFAAAVFPLGALWAFEGPKTLQAMFVSGLVLVVATLAVTAFWKVSQHVMGITSMATIVTILLGPIAAPLFLIVPLVAWARVRVGAHTIAQTVVGGLLGLGAAWGAFALFGLV